MSSYSKLQLLERKMSEALSNKNQKPKKELSTENGEDSVKRSNTPSETGEDYSKRSNSSSERDFKRMKKSINVSMDEEHADVLDRSFGDFYCKLCDKHMNSFPIWESHVRGKVHAKNSKRKHVQNDDQKYETVDENPLISSELKRIDSPMVGLQHISEIQRLDRDCMYQCFLCSACMPTATELIKHVKSLKHKMQFIKKNYKGKFDLIDQSKLPKDRLEPVVDELVGNHEAKYGRNRMLVQKEKPKKMPKICSKSPSPVRVCHKRDVFCVDYRHGSPELVDYRSPNHFDDEVEIIEYKQNVRTSYERADNFKYRATQQKENCSFPTKLESPATSHWPTVPKTRDLRQLLDEKKALPNATLPPPEKPLFDQQLEMINAMPTVTFLQLALFKLKNISEDEIEDVEIKTLDQIISRATALTMAAKKRRDSAVLKAKFMESLADDGASLPSRGAVTAPMTDMEQLLQIINTCKTKTSVQSANSPLSSTVSDFSSDGAVYRSTYQANTTSYSLAHNNSDLSLAERSKPSAASHPSSSLAMATKRFLGNDYRYDSNQNPYPSPPVYSRF